MSSAPFSSISTPHATDAVSIHIQLRTHVGLSLFEGNWGKRRFGLRQFAAHIPTLFKAIQADDPYAELFLLATYQVLTETTILLKRWEDAAQQRLAQLRGVTVQPLLPIRKTIAARFSEPFAHLGIPLLTDADHLVCYLRAITQLGLTHPDGIHIHHVIEKTRRVFAKPFGWRSFGVTRQDILQATAKGEKAQALWGTLPEAILKKEIQFRFLDGRREPTAKTRV